MVHVVGLQLIRGTMDGSYLINLYLETNAINFQILTDLELTWKYTVGAHYCEHLHIEKPGLSKIFNEQNCIYTFYIGTSSLLNFKVDITTVGY